MRKLAILDIDGTLADGSHRHHLIEGPNPDWKAFLTPEQVLKDTPMPGSGGVLIELARRGYEFIVLTGRNESLRSATKEWLVHHFASSLGHYPQLIMRPKGSEEIASAYKERHVFDSAVWGKFDEILAFDDDAYMWPVYARHGAIPFKAPECWDLMFPKPTADLPPEVPWRK